jgi:CheY-like chemotaxis protein
VSSVQDSQGAPDSGRAGVSSGSFAVAVSGTSLFFLALLGGLDALALLGTDRYDVVLLDINMAGMDGIETCKEI